MNDDVDGDNDDVISLSQCKTLMIIIMMSSDDDDTNLK